MDGRATNGEGLLNPAKHRLVEQVIRTPGRQPSPQPTLLGVPGASASSSNVSLHRTLGADHDGPGYVAPKFEGKKAQMEEVMDLIEEKGFLPTEFIASETEWFYNALGIDDMYFSTESVEAVASNILSLYAAKLAAYARDDKKLEIQLAKEAADHAVYIDTSKPG
ncbi:NAD-dependent glutamate dehydrogenase, partial [Exophiala xenobiotica]